MGANYLKSQGGKVLIVGADYVIKGMVDRGIILYQETELLEIQGRNRVESVHLQKGDRDWIVDVDTVFLELLPQTGFEGFSFEGPKVSVKTAREK